jgi:hypothetical protein
MQMGLASAVNSAEIAFHQGIDLYTENENRIMAAMEFQASPLLGNPVPQDLFLTGFVASDLLPTWEIAYNHFHNRKGFTLPMTDTLIRTKIRPSYFMTMLNMAWESITHAELDNSIATSIRNQQITEGGYSLTIVPNPVNSNFTINYTVTELSSIEFTMYDMNGNLIDKQKDENIQSLNGVFPWTINSDLGSGVYYISMQQKGKKVAACKLIKVQ